nr:PREDICTED: 26S proteasome non-ATPase regulatory subunit 12 [Bemisia tabaci]
MAAKVNGTAEDKVVKMEVDYISSFDEKLEAAKKTAAEGNLYEALESLLSLEKQTRTNVDLTSTSRVLVTVVEICYNAKNWNALNEHIILLSKRRSQIKEAVTKMVQECCKYVDKTPSKEIKTKLIDTLRSVTEGKIYVEVERARLTHILAKMKEDDGDIQGAATIIQELQVETYGSMEKKEKVELILEQMRLCLAKRDYIRTQIISKKINTKFFEDESTSELKLKYYRIMIQLERHEGSYLNTCKHYRAILNTKCIQDNAEESQATLQNVVLYLILAPYSNEQADLTHRVMEEKILDQIPLHKELLRLFMTAEVIQWSSLCEKYEKELKNGSAKSKPTSVFDSSEEGQKRWKDLKIRVAEHNIRIMAKYYTRITLKRMSELLDLSIEETEEFLSNMVTNKTVSAKTDRPAGIVNFASMKDPTDILNDWASHINSLMKLVNHTTHLINKEQMVYMHLMALGSNAAPPAVESASN